MAAFPVALALGLLVGAYLVGSFPTGVVLAHLRGVDLRAVGSGNIGATNVARALGKRWAVLVLVLDAAKGFAPTLAAQRAFADTPRAAELVVAVGLTAILGHVFPVWLRFRGGKGVATALGVFLALAPLASALCVAVYAVLYAIFRISSLGSLVAATTMPVVLVASRAPTATLALAATGWLLIVVRHRANIRRLLRREEGKV